MANITATLSSLLDLLWSIHSTPAFLFLLTTFSFLFLLRHFSTPAHPHSTNKNQPRPFPLPPGPKPWPLVGSLITLHVNKPCFRWILALMQDKSIACIRLGGVHVIVVNCPVIAREFLKQHDATFASRPVTASTHYFSRGFRAVVVSPWGDQWKKMKRVLVSELLCSKRLKSQHDLRVEEADNLVKYIYNQCKNGGAVVDVRLAVRQYCGNVIRRMVFNRRHFGEGGRGGYGGPGVEEVEHVEAAFDVLSHIYAFSVGDYFPWLRWVGIDGNERKVKKAMDVINKYHDPIIDERVEKWRNGKEEEVEDLLDVLLSLKDSNGEPMMTIDEIRAETTELVLATVDNPSNAVEWALAEILNQPEILNKAMEELNRVVGTDRLVQESDFPQLPYIKACAREAFRLHPVTPFNVPHMSVHDANVAGYFIPQGSHVLLSRVGLGRNPDVWDVPLRFDPERHLKDGSARVEIAEPDLRFITFATGRRGCPGGPIGTAMTYMLLARVLQGFNWSVGTTEGIDLKEEENSLFIAKPLHAFAKPRLALLENV